MSARHSVWLSGLLIVSLGLALTTGQFPLSSTDLWHILSPGSHSEDPRLGLVFWQIRLPRILAALLIGAGLSVAGAAYQGMFRNPLVSPDILGVSAGAGLGAVLALWLGCPIWLTQLMAFCGGIFTVLLVCLIGRFSQRLDPLLSLVLVGIALGTLCGAGISLIKIMADPYSQLPAITFWLLGGLSSVTLTDLTLATPLILLGLVPILLLRWRMNLLSLPDDEARALGIPLTTLRMLFVVCATLITASAVSIAGIIGWVGLVVPHICRLICGANHQRLLPLCMLMGGILLLLTDTLARGATDQELPLGILTALVGAPFFLFLLLRAGEPR